MSNVAITKVNHLKRMSELAQNQLNFQEYNQRLGGPESPIDMNQLKKSAEEENTKQAAMGMVFDVETSTYVPSSVNVSDVQDMITDTPTPPLKRKIECVDNIVEPTLASIDMKRVVYEVYTNHTITDKFSPGNMRICYVGKESWDTAKEARDVADIIRNKGMQDVYVVKCERKLLKNRKRAKKTPSPRTKRVKKNTYKSLEEINPPKEWYGSFKPLNGSLKAKGKQSTWWVSSMLQLDGSDFKEQIRSAAKMIRRVPADTVVGWTKSAANLDDEMNCWKLHVDDDNDKNKIRQMTYRIRQSIKSADKMLASPVSDDASLANA